jgi:asparagine synthase (glutamine-hydrolysing)
MCGFVISAQTEQNNIKGLNGVGSDTLARGPDGLRKKVVQFGDLNILIEFAHLLITQPKSYQPIESEQYILVLNGEIYNYRELAGRVDNGTLSINDTQEFLSHIVEYGLEHTLQKTNGMYSGVLIYKDSGRCVAFTDHVGKKPLLMWDSNSGWHIGTGIDTNYIDRSSSSLQVLAPGIYEIELKSGRVKQLAPHQTRPVCNTHLGVLLQEAVSARIPEGLPFAVALSGGLDSSILAYIIEKQLCLTPEYFVVGEQLPDGVISLMSHLGISSKRIKLIRPSNCKDLKALISETCSVVKSYNPSIISNGMATMLLTKAIHDAGYRVLLGGEGADEFFCGYQAMYNGKHCPEEMRLSLIADLHFTELRRLDLISSHHAVEARCPFLDYRVTQRALSIATKHHCNSDSNTGKILLRNLYQGLLPDNIIDAHKEPFDITSGLQKKVIDTLKKFDQSEREVLKTEFINVMGGAAIFNHSYFSEYPTFDEMIDQRDKKYKVELHE